MASFRSLVIWLLLALPFFATAQTDTLVDVRDGRHYPIRRFGQKVWMMSNLAFAPVIYTRKKAEDTAKSIIGKPGMYSFLEVYEEWLAFHKNLVFTVRDDSSKIDAFGALYPWSAAVKSCPAGWRLPSKEEYRELWDELNKLGMTDNQFQPKKAGKLIRFGTFAADFVFRDKIGFYWTSTEKQGFNGRMITKAVIGSKLKNFFFEKINAQESDASSVRCIKD